MSVSLNAKQSKLFKLALAVKPRPVITNITLSGASLLIRGTNGVSGETYVLLGSYKHYPPSESVDATCHQHI